MINSAVREAGIGPDEENGSTTTRVEATSRIRRMAELLKLILKFKVLTTLLFTRKRLYAVLSKGRADEKLMVNVGGALFFRPHWKTLDYVSPFYPFNRKYIDYNFDLCSGDLFPFDDASVSYFYSAHTLEHIPQENCPHILHEMYRCLKPGGAVRLNMPDYDRMREAVGSGDETYFPSQLAKGLTLAEAVVEQIATERVGKTDAETVRRNFETMNAAEFANYYTTRASRDVQKDKGGYHINWFNEEKLSAMLREAGFTEVYRSEPQGSRFPELTGKGGVLAFGDVLEVQRWLGIDATVPNKSLYVEAVK